MADTIPSSSIGKDVITRRLYARGLWSLSSPAHFGGADTGVADMCLLRDTNGQPFIPAASIAGAGRGFLARHSLPWRDYACGLGNEPLALKRFFGGAEKADTMSALFIADAPCLEGTTLVRDSVRIDAETGTAATGAKFDIEVVDRGGAFQLRLECLIRHGDDEQSLEQWFLALLHGFQEGAISLGARTRRGYGRGQVASWEIRDLKMNRPVDVLAWLRGKVWSRPASGLVPHHLPDDKREIFRLEAQFALHTSLLIRSPSAMPDAPDAVHLHSAGQAVAPGTSLAGVIRHRTALIARTIGWSEEAVQYTMAEMFGPVHAPKNSSTTYKGLWASRVHVDEQLVQHVKSRRQHRVAIDRFTGGSLEHALFDEEPVYPQGDGPHLSVTLTLEEPDDAEIGLLVLTLRDLWLGHVGLGGETSNGRGTLRGKWAQLRVQRNGPANLAIWEFTNVDEAMNLIQGQRDVLDRYIAKAQKPPDQPAGSRRPVQGRDTKNVTSNP